ncbi:MAG: hypothetical protein QW774_02800 [Candidatus Micrarchaeaceae archaeon]
MSINKADDEIWLLRKIISKPNYALLRLLMEKSPRSTKEIYIILGKKFTRKTLIISLRDLSMNFNAIQPAHIRTERGYGLGYAINPALKGIIKNLEKFEKSIEGMTKL